MSLETALIAYVAAAALLTLTPGLDTAIVLRTAAVEGPLKAAQAALGAEVGRRGLSRLARRQAAP